MEKRVGNSIIICKLLLKKTSYSIFNSSYSQNNTEYKKNPNSILMIKHKVEYKQI